MRYQEYNLGNGKHKHAVYDVPVIDRDNYWANVTDIGCPVYRTGTIRWNEAGYVPGSRLCDHCGRFFQARGSIQSGVSLMRDKRFDKRRRSTQ